MDNKLLYKNKYDTLNIEEKQTLLNNIALHYGFNIKEFASFKSDETQFYTAVFTDDSNREFVFIPGAKSVSLGWKKTISGKKEDTALIEYIKEAMFDFLLLSLDESNPVTKWGRYASLEEIKNNATEKEYDLIDKTLTRLTLSLIDDNTSYIRKVDIKPMLVERRSESVDWEFVRNIKSSDVADSPTYFKIYQEIAKSGKNFVIKKSTVKSNNKKVQKFVIDDKGLLVYKYKEVNNEELLFDYISEGYNIPSINQWEYIASSGISTLFINDDVLYSQIAQNKPNGFGVFICNNVYEPEISELREAYEALIEAGANFASSPARILIDFIDPLIVAEKIAVTERYKYITIEDIENELRDGKQGVSGIGANGKMYKIRK